MSGSKLNNWLIWIIYTTLTHIHFGYAGEHSEQNVQDSRYKDSKGKETIVIVKSLLLVKKYWLFNPLCASLCFSEEMHYGIWAILLHVITILSCYSPVIQLPFVK